MSDEVISIPEILAPFRVTIIGTPNLDATRATNAAYRAGVRDRRALCNAAGGLVGKAGSECYFGDEAYNKANEILNNPDAPQGIKDKAQGWLDVNPRETEDTTTDDSAISDEDAIASVLATVPDQLKGIITEENVMTVLETVIDDPMTKIKKDMGAGVEIIFPQDWRNWKVFSTIAIPGVPLPPGIIDVTIQDVIDAVGNIGGTLKDFVTKPGETLGKLGDWVTKKVEGVFGGTEDDPGWGGTLGGFEDWVTGTLGGIVGGAVLVDIYDGVKGIFDSNTNTTTTVVPGGTTTDEETTPTPKQGDDTVNLGGSSTAVERPPPDDIFVDTTDDSDTNELFGGRNQTEVVDGTKDLTFVDGDDDDDRRKTEIGGGDSSDNDEPTTVIDRTPDTTIIVEPPKPTIEIGGYTDDVVIDPEPTPDPVEIGGPEPTPSGGGGGGGMLSGDSASPFDIREIAITAEPALQKRQEFPITEYLMGMFTGNRNKVA